MPHAALIGLVVFGITLLAAHATLWKARSRALSITPSSRSGSLTLPGIV